MEHSTPPQLPEWKGIRIADWLGSNDKDVLAEIECLLDRSGPEAIDALLLLLLSEGREFRKYRLGCRVAFGVLGALCVGLLIVCPALFPFAFTGVISLTISALLFIPIWFFCYEAFQTPRRRLRNVAVLLSKYRSAHTVGGWLDALEFGDAMTQSLATTVLIEILPYLRANDGGLLANRHHARLHQILLHNKSELILATLQALEQVGTDAAIPYVVSLTCCSVETENGVLLRNVASECLLSLRRRAQEQSNTHSLLRAVNLPPKPPHLLLHNVASSPEWETQTLPRRTSSEAE